MSDSQMFSTALNCTIANLSIGNLENGAVVNLAQSEPLYLSVCLTFSDEAKGELVKLLMPSGLTVRATFFAKPNCPSPQIELGEAQFQTRADALTYTAVVLVEDLTPLKSAIADLYQIAVAVRVGGSPLCFPSLMRGYFESAPFTVALVDAPAIGSASDESEPPFAIAKAKTSRRRVSKSLSRINDALG
jgi:hypothetical protein